MHRLTFLWRLASLKECHLCLGERIETQIHPHRPFKLYRRPLILYIRPLNQRGSSLICLWMNYWTILAQDTKPVSKLPLDASKRVVPYQQI